MTKIFHKKLVRDKIPEIIKNSGNTYQTRILNDLEFEVELKRKLIEESVEVSKASKEELIEELADVLEIVYGLADFNKINLEDVENKRKIKKEKRGGFDKKIFLDWSEKED
jgi:predicted house-cleaning noncanonical NTP pyrophosphatase (MazG superfamily)